MNQRLSPCTRGKFMPCLTRYPKSFNLKRLGITVAFVIDYLFVFSRSLKLANFEESCTVEYCGPWPQAVLKMTIQNHVI